MACKNPSISRIREIDSGIAAIKRLQADPAVTLSIGLTGGHRNVDELGNSADYDVHILAGAEGSTNILDALCDALLWERRQLADAAIKELKELQLAVDELGLPFWSPQ